MSSNDCDNDRQPEITTAAQTGSTYVSGSMIDSYENMAAETETFETSLP